MTEICYEIVVYRTGNAEQADFARKHARTMLACQPGFIAWTSFTGAADTSERVDLVAWADIHRARAAAQVVGTVREFAGFRASVASITTIAHYRPASLDPQPVAAGAGIELARFRLKPDYEEAAMRAAYNAMVSRHLGLQAGWRRQHLVKLQDGTFVDLA